MAYNQILANRIREQLQHLEAIEEKEMMGGLCFLLNDPAFYEEALERTGCREMDFTGRPMKGWVFVDDSGMKTLEDLNYWIGLSIDYNKRAKSSKKKK